MGDILIATDFSSFDGFGSMMLAVTVWNFVTLACVYVVCGLFAGWFIRKRLRIAMLIPAFGTLGGLILGFVEGAVYAISVALIYVSAGFSMPWYISVAWGVGIAVFHIVVSVVKAFSPHSS